MKAELEQLDDWSADNDDENTAEKNESKFITRSKLCKVVLKVELPIMKQGVRQDSEAATDLSILVAYSVFSHKLSPNLSSNI